jgi:hypothetical protein
MMMTGELEIIIYLNLVLCPGHAVVPLRVTSQQSGQLPLSHLMEVG